MTQGERVRQARELLGWTQAELARRIKVTQPVIAQLEAGAYDGSALVSAIAFQTGFLPSYFSDPYIEDFPLGSLQFRGHSKMTRADRLQAYRYGQLVYEVLQRVRTGIRPIPVTIPQITDRNPVQAALATRSAMGLSPDTPIKNLVNSAELAGVVILGLPVELDGRDAFSAWADGRPVIALSANRPGDRVRLTVAHELGHLVMHLAIRGNLRDLEAQAFEFASELLMPQVAMFQEIMPPVTLTTLAPLKLRWKVSLQALIRRARSLRIISERQAYYLFEQIGRSGRRTVEQTDWSVPLEKPRALRQMIERRYGRPIDMRRLASDTKLTPKMLQSIIEAHAEGPKPTGRDTKNVLTLRRVRT